MPEWESSAVPNEFVLYVGTALALHLGHRDSIDFDFFGNRPLDISRLETGVSFLSGAKVVQREKNTLSAIVDRDGPVKVSFFGVPNLPRSSAPHIAADNGLQIASLLDLAGTKGVGGPGAGGSEGKTTELNYETPASHASNAIHCT